MALVMSRSIVLTMTSEDVIHSFFIPAFRVKNDVLPGRYTTAWFRATKPGVYQLNAGNAAYPVAVNVPADEADVLLLAGDLTRHGTVDEAHVVADEFRDLPVPVVAVLGNHDYHADQAERVVGVLSDAGIRVLEGDGLVDDLLTPGTEATVRSHAYDEAVAGTKANVTLFSRACPRFVEFVERGDQASDELLKVAQLDFEVACFGHGAPVVGGAGQQIRALAETFR